MTRSRDLANLGDNTSKLEQVGLIQVIHSSVAVGSGYGSFDANGAVTFSGASSISINGIFSSTYDNYRIVLNLVSSSQIDLGLRFRTGSDDTGGTNQARTVVWGNDGGSSGTSSVNATGLIIGWGQSTKEGTYPLDISNPNLAKNTNVSGAVAVGYSTSTNFITAIVGGQQQTVTQYTGLTIYNFAGSANHTGTFRVYGYKN